MTVKNQSGQTNPKTIVGIDYSLNSPAICVTNGGGTSFSDCSFYYLTSKKKYIGKMYENIIGYELKENNGPIDRFKNLSDWVLHILDTLQGAQTEKEVFIEGYSYGSKGQAIFQIAENGQFDKLVFVQFRIVDVDVNDGAVFAELLHLPGDAIVKPHSNGEE